MDSLSDIFRFAVEQVRTAESIWMRAFGAYLLSLFVLVPCLMAGAFFAWAYYYDERQDEGREE